MLRKIVLLVAVVGVLLIVFLSERAPDGFPRGAVSAVALTGTYTSGSETSAFVPCEAGETEAAARLWVTVAPGVDFFARVAALNPFPPDAIEVSMTAYVRVVGNLTPFGDRAARQGYGHRGLYSRELTITKVVEVSRDPLCDR